jgi:hypothetical protein
VIGLAIRMHELEIETVAEGVSRALQRAFKK